jgi:hypothetical protein
MRNNKFGKNVQTYNRRWNNGRPTVEQYTLSDKKGKSKHNVDNNVLKRQIRQTKALFKLKTLTNLIDHILKQKNGIVNNFDLQRRLLYRQLENFNPTLH